MCSLIYIMNWSFHKRKRKNFFNFFFLAVLLFNWVNSHNISWVHSEKLTRGCGHESHQGKRLLFRNMHVCNILVHKYQKVFSLSLQLPFIDTCTCTVIQHCLKSLWTVSSFFFLFGLNLVLKLIFKKVALKNF